MSDLINQVINNYKITEEIAMGGMGSVYKATYQKLNRKVAIKVINPNLISNPSIINRFYKEAKIQAKMNHINIVTVYDFFQHQGNYFLVMEHLDGESLDKILDQQDTFDVFTALSMFKQMLSGLSHAHSKGIIHKDIKTSNFILTPRVIKISDFGISQTINENPKEEKQMGTLDYMSPEQLLGNKIDYRTDLYSLSIVFYEILTGRSPYGSELSSENEMRKTHLELDPVPIRKINSDVPPEIDQIIRKGLSKDPNTRHQSCMDYLIAIDRYLNANKTKRIKTSELSEGKHESSINLRTVDFTHTGQLKDTPFHKLLLESLNNKNTGFLFIDSNIKLQIYFNNGFIANVSGVIHDLMLGELLVKTSQITKEDQKNAVNFSLETGLKIGEVLITMNKLSTHELSTLLESQIKEKLKRGFLMRDGTYAYKKLDSLQLNYAYNINPLQIIYDHIVTSEYSDLEEGLWAQKMNTQYKVCSDIEEKLKDVKFSNSKEIRIIDSLKKPNKLINPIRDINLDKELKFNLLHFLTIAELIEVAKVTDGSQSDEAQSTIQDTESELEQDEQLKDIKKKRYEVKVQLSSGATMSYKEEVKLPGNMKDSGDVNNKNNTQNNTKTNTSSAPQVKKKKEEQDADTDRTEIFSTEQRDSLIEKHKNK